MPSPLNAENMMQQGGNTNTTRDPKVSASGFSKNTAINDVQLTLGAVVANGATAFGCQFNRMKAHEWVVSGALEQFENNFRLSWAHTGVFALCLHRQSTGTKNVCVEAR